MKEQKYKEYKSQRTSRMRASKMLGEPEAFGGGEVEEY
jgi:hypothetical protein